MNIKIYTTPTCGYCHQAKQFLNERGVNYTEYDVSRDQAAANEMVQQTGQMGVPVIVIDGEVVLGFNRARLEQLLAGKAHKNRPSFGLSVADASKITQKHGKPPIFGAFIGKVAPSSPGAKAGLKSGDVVTEVNMRPVHNADDLEHALAALHQGSRVTIQFTRGHENLKSEVLL
jgi:glutaredoxin-like YruB-family protein